MHSDRLYLFGIPYAGGSAVATYGRWARLLPANIKLAPLELAGRGRRTPEPFHTTMQEAVAELLTTIAPIVRTTPYAIYGHSMGTAVTYELVKAIAAEGLPAPRQLFLSGRNCPHHPYSQRNLHLLDDERFLAEIRQLGGTPEEFFAMKDLVAAFLPVLRADYRLIEQYWPERPLHVTSADIVFLCSDQDPLVGKPAVYDWQHYTSGQFELREFSGGHFFINDHTPQVCQVIAEAVGRQAA